MGGQAITIDTLYFLWACIRHTIDYQICNQELRYLGDLEIIFEPILNNFCIPEQKSQNWSCDTHKRALAWVTFSCQHSEHMAHLLYLRRNINCRMHASISKLHHAGTR